MAYKFRGTTVTFGSSVGRLRSVTKTVGGSEIDITNSLSAAKEFEMGFDEISVRYSVIGATAPTRGTPGQLTITWNDSVVYGPYNFICSDVETSGDVDGAIMSTVTVKPTSA